MIKKLSLKDFKTHKNTELEFSSGINVITGDSGCGKTNILLGLNLVVDNRPLGGNWIRRGQDSGVVEMEVGEGKELCKITRSRGKVENSYTIENNGVKLDPFTGFGNSPPIMVSEIINLSDLNVQKQRDQHFLVYLPPGQIATYIRSITKLDEIDQVTKSLSGKIRTEKGLIATQQEELKITNEKLVVLGAINLHLLESKIEEAKGHIEEVKRLEGKIERINTILNNLRVLEEHQIYIPDNIDQIFSSVEQFSKTIIEVLGRIDKFKPLIDKIKNIEAHEIVLPENLEIVSTVENTLEQYNNIDKELEILIHLLQDIQEIDSSITKSSNQLKQVEEEKVELMEKLDNCPSCGMELTEEAKTILLEG